MQNDSLGIPEGSDKTIMKRFSLVCLMFLSFAVSAEDQSRYLNGFDVKTDIISDNYEAGNGLIYDCKEKHWVCVSNVNFEECREKRAKEKLNEDSTTLPCAHISYFPNKKSCFQRQLFMTTHHHGDRFCVKDEWKLKASSN